MPVYEFYCPDCAKKFDKLCSFSQSDSKFSCPHCQGQRAERCISRFASFSKDSSGSTQSIGGGSSCASCHSGSCATCH
jgi:putative FmdB family regulatory protein